MQRHTDPLSTRFLGAPQMLELVRRVGLSACIAGVAAQIERDFLRWSEFDKSARVACYSAAGVIELMPVADAQRFAFKYVNGHPGNPALGLPTVMAFGVLADVATGAPRLLAELTLLTAIRTAAMSALVARRLARTGSRTMALLGNGAQAEFQAIAFRDLVGVRELRLYDIDPAATRKLLSNLRDASLGLRVCASVAQAVRGADIVTTLTAARGRAAVLRRGMLEPGMHINAVGGDSPGKTELERAVLEAARVFVEFEPQTRVEGELQQLPADFRVTEFEAVLARRAPGRLGDDEITLFDSVGFALEDYSALTFALEMALRHGIGAPIELVAPPQDPKDLFGLLRAASAPGPGPNEEPAR